MAKSLSKTRVSNIYLRKIYQYINIFLITCIYISKLFTFYCYSQTNNAPFLRPAVLQDYSSDGDTEDE